MLEDKGDWPRHTKDLEKWLWATVASLVIVTGLVVDRIARFFGTQERW